jgi:succinoglycan biosynthesis transport protein ExoP
MTPESTGQQDVRTYLRILWRWKLLLLAFLVLIPLAAYFVERSKPKIYQSSTLISPRLGSAFGGSAVTFSLPGVARLVTTTPVARAAAALLHPPASPGSLLGEVSTSFDTTTGFLTITAQDHDPRQAATIANAFAAALGNHQTAQARHSIDAQITALLKQLAALPRRDVVDRAPLSQQITTLRALRESTGGGAQVIQAAVASATPASPNVRRAVELAFVIALLLGIGAVVLAENSDLRLRTPEALEQLTGMPLLGVIPPSAFSLQAHEAPQEDEAFQMLRAALTYFNVDRPLSSVAIISPGPQDGKTTVAAGLALATARAGKSTILVDADLRRPQASTRLGITSTDGLGAVLARERQLSEVLVEVPLDAPGSGRLLVLPAGPPPPNPSALLSSQEMRTLLRELEGQADLVIVDTAAALAVSDALPLLRSVSGVVMIVRMNRSSRAAVRRLQKVIASASGTVMGVVATGRVSATGYGSAYDYSYAQSQDGRAPRSLFRRRRWRRAATRKPTGSSPSALEHERAPRSAPASSPNGAATPEPQPETPQPQPQPASVAGKTSQAAQMGLSAEPALVEQQPPPHSAPAPSPNIAAEPRPQSVTSPGGGARPTTYEQPGKEQTWRDRARQRLRRFG